MRRVSFVLVAFAVASLMACNIKAPTQTKGSGKASVEKEADTSGAPDDDLSGRAGFLTSERARELLSRPVPAVGSKADDSDEHYQSFLTDEEFNVLREAGTERAFTGLYWDEKRDGVYRCRACNAPLYEAKTKFKSGTGWPSYYAPIEGRVETREDNAYGMKRTEIVCAHCSSHLGHVFDDGPEPTGLRHCVNAVSLVLDPTE